MRQLSCYTYPSISPHVSHALWFPQPSHSYVDQGVGVSEDITDIARYFNSYTPWYSNAEDPHNIRTQRTNSHYHWWEQRDRSWERTENEETEDEETEAEETEDEKSERKKTSRKRRRKTQAKMSVPTGVDWTVLAELYKVFTYFLTLKGNL